MNGKYDGFLQFALEMPERILVNTKELRRGYNEQRKTWEVIVKYHGSLSKLENMGILVEPLLGGIAILTVPREKMDSLGEIAEIEYIEKPMAFYYDLVEPAMSPCVLQVTGGPLNLSGEGVLIAIIDSGIDFTRKDFLNENGQSRILFLWDQGRENERGEYSGKELQKLIESKEKGQQLTIEMDTSGHGTAVAGVAAGSLYGVAKEAGLIVVKLAGNRDGGFAKTTDIMRGIDYCIRKALELQMPLVINLSLGNNYGSHNGKSMLDFFLNQAAQIGRTVICVGMGNEGDAGRHCLGKTDGTSVEFVVGYGETYLNLQLWKKYSKETFVTLISPNGNRFEAGSSSQVRVDALETGRENIYIYFGLPTPTNTGQLICLEFFALEGEVLTEGVWKIAVVEKGRNKENTVYDLYMPTGNSIGVQTRFLKPETSGTLTIPATADSVISVGAYDSMTNSYATFSGRGYEGSGRQNSNPHVRKPDVVAPGVEVLAPWIYGGYKGFSGTSFSTPFVAGCAALLLEWGIVKGNDRELYGEKVKAYLQEGAREVLGEGRVPNDKVGYGSVCIANSIPFLR